MEWNFEQSCLMLLETETFENSKYGMGMTTSVFFILLYELENNYIFESKVCYIAIIASCSTNILKIEVFLDGRRSKSWLNSCLNSDENNKLPLVIAARNNHLDIVQYLRFKYLLAYYLFSANFSRYFNESVGFQMVPLNYGLQLFIFKILLFLMSLFVFLDFVTPLRDACYDGHLDIGNINEIVVGIVYSLYYILFGFFVSNVLKSWVSLLNTFIFEFLLSPAVFLVFALYFVKWMRCVDSVNVQLSKTLMCANNLAPFCDPPLPLRPYKCDSVPAIQTAR
uniref:ANK_REP_REGION domain-containing protein n=1 Tax=Heterorhabditis bacteriophora TaxID=37862 RepID=A0A1I7X2H7_HETBA